MKKSGIIGGIVVALVLIFGLIAAITCLEKVPTGYVAEIQAEQALIKAQAEADALEIAAQAEAEANSKIAASLTPELIEKIKYEQWNGQMPSTMTGTDSSILITP